MDVGLGGTYVIFWSRRGRDLRIRSALVRDTPNAALDVVRDIKRAVRTHGKPGGSVCCATRCFLGSGKTVSEDDIVAGGLTIAHRLVDDVVTSLGSRRAVPGAVKGHEGAATIGLRELRARIDQQRVRRPMRGEDGDGCSLLRAESNRLATVAAVFRREYQLVLKAVEIAAGPTIVRPGFQLHDFLSGQSSSLFGAIKVGPALVELITTVLGNVQAPRSIERHALAVTDAGGVPLGG